MQSPPESTARNEPTATTPAAGATATMAPSDASGRAPQPRKARPANTPESSAAASRPPAPRRAGAIFTWLGIAVTLGLLASLAIGFLGVPSPGFFGLDTAMLVMGSALAVLGIGLVSALFASRGALRAVENEAQDSAWRVAEHLEEISALQDKRLTEHRDAIYAQAGRVEKLARRDEQMEQSLAAVRAQMRGEHAFAAGLRARADRLEDLAARLDMDAKAEFTKLRQADALLEAKESGLEAKEADLEAALDRVRRSAAAARSASTRETRRAEATEGSLKAQLSKARREADGAVDALRRRTARLRNSMAKVMAEERERKAEFEALAAEEIRLMGRVRRHEEHMRGEPERLGEYYRISRPKATHRGPFGLVYPVQEIEGVTEARAKRLREFGITTSEHLWRANPKFVAALLHCDEPVVEVWQEEAELMAVHGIGKQRAKALVDAGVTSLEKLGQEEPKRLVRLVGKVDEGPSVTEENAQKWVQMAKKLQPTT